MKIIEIKNLKVITTVVEKKDKRQFISVDGVNLSINADETAAIVGDSKAGKSILTKLIAEGSLGNSTISAGGIEYLFGSPKDVVSSVFSNHRKELNEKRVINDILVEKIKLLLPELSNVEIQTRLNELYNQVDIDSLKNRKVKKLTEADIQKFLISAAFFRPPVLFVYDIPKENISKPAKHEIVRILDSLQKIYHNAILYSTREIDAVGTYAKIIHMMSNGKFTLSDTYLNIIKSVPILSASNVEVKFTVRGKELTAIRGISLNLYRGETLAIVGESGSGKSVLTKTFTGMLESNGRISKGSIIFEGQELTKLKTNADWRGIRGNDIATVFQDPMTSLNPLLSIGTQISEVLRFHNGMSKEEAKAETLELLKKVGIKNPAERYRDKPFMYSGGMRQRVVIAIALACRPKILICDEPTTALDVTIQAQIIELIKDLQKEYGFATIYITHDLGVVAKVADKVSVMYAGQIIETGLANEIFYDPRHPYTWALLSSLPQLGDRRTALFSIVGTPPSLFKEIKGDAFAERNPYSLKIDFMEEPPLFKVSETHYAKTWLLDPRAPQVEAPEVIKGLSQKLEKVRVKVGE